MKKLNIAKAILMIAVLFASCHQQEEEVLALKNTNEHSATETFSALSGGGTPTYCKDGTYWGSPVYFNRSRIRSYVIMQNARPKEIGYEIQQSAFIGLPNLYAPEEQEILVPLPTNATCTYSLFNHLTFHWNPQGHDPMGVYTTPHFDFHFYTISVTERRAIDETDPAIMLAPDYCYLPAYFYGPTGPMSDMGSHWVDLLAPEFNGGTFTRAFIYGSHKGKVIFQEPMATLTYLQRSFFTDIVPIRLPDQYQKSGYYPTNYKISSDDTYVTVSLTDFVFRATAECLPIE